MADNEASTSASLPTVLCRLTIGHKTEYLEKKTEDNRTHWWKVVVRAPDDCPPYTDRSFIKKVTFLLHETFKNQKRSVRKPPFETEDTAYGCFEMPIKIQFKNIEKTFSISYDITLSMKKKSVQVQFDHFIEIVNPPSKDFIRLVLKYGGKLKTTALERPIGSALKPVDKPSENDDKHKKTMSLQPPAQPDSTKPAADLKAPAPPDDEHSKKHSKHKKRKDNSQTLISDSGDKSKESKKKKDRVDRDKKERSESSVKPEAHEASDSVTQKPTLADPTHSAIGEPLPKRIKTDEDDEASSTSGPIKFSTTKRPKFFVSSKDKLKELAIDGMSQVKEEVSPTESLVGSLSKELFGSEAIVLEKLPSVFDQVDELVQPLAAPISPIGKLKRAKSDDSDEPQHSSPPLTSDAKNLAVKDDASLEQVDRIWNLLIRPIKRKNYSLSILHKLENVEDEFASRYERPIPLVTFDPDFSKIVFKTEDNRKLFETKNNNDEPQMLRLLKRKSRTPSPVSNTCNSKFNV